MMVGISPVVRTYCDEGVVQDSGMYLAGAQDVIAHRVWGNR